MTERKTTLSPEPPHWRKIAPSVLTVWVFVVIGAGISMAPMTHTLSSSWDDQIFQPGALSLIEAVRLHRLDILLGVRQSLGLLLLGQVVLLVARARMSAVIFDVEQNNPPRPQLFARVPAYFAVTLLKVISIGLCVGLGALAARELPPFDGAVPPFLLFRYAVVGIATSFLLGYAVIFCEILRLSLFFESPLRKKVQRTWRTLKMEALPLFTTRALQAIMAGSTGFVMLCISGRPVAEGSAGALATFALSQALVLMNLALEAWWLSRAARALANYSAAEWAEAAPR